MEKTQTLPHMSLRPAVYNSCSLSNNILLYRLQKIVPFPMIFLQQHFLRHYSDDVTHILGDTKHLYKRVRPSVTSFDLSSDGGVLEYLVLCILPCLHPRR